MYVIPMQTDRNDFFLESLYFLNYIMKPKFSLT